MSDFGFRKMGGGSGGDRFRTATPLSVRPQLRRGIAVTDCTSHATLDTLNVVHDFWQGPDPFQPSVTVTYPPGAEGDLLVAFLVVSTTTFPTVPTGWTLSIANGGTYTSDDRQYVYWRIRGSESDVTFVFNIEDQAWDVILLDTPNCPTGTNEMGDLAWYAVGVTGLDNEFVPNSPVTVPFAGESLETTLDVLNVWTRSTAVTSWWDPGQYTLEDDPTPDRTDAGFVPLTTPTEGTQVLWVRESEPRRDTLLTMNTTDYFTFFYGYTKVEL